MGQQILAKDVQILRNWAECSPALGDGKEILMPPDFDFKLRTAKTKSTHSERPRMLLIHTQHYLPTCPSVPEVLPVDIQQTQWPNHGQTSHVPQYLHLPTAFLGILRSLTPPDWWLLGYQIVKGDQTVYTSPLIRLLPCFLLHIFISFPKESKNQKVAARYGH